MKQSNINKINFWNPYTGVALLLIIGVIVGAYVQQGKITLVSTNASSVANLSWVLTEPEITVSTKIYRTTTDFLEDPDDQYYIGMVAAPNNTYADTSTSSGVTYYYSIFQVDDAGVLFDPAYDTIVPTDIIAPPGGGGSGGGGSGGGSGGGTGGGSQLPPASTAGARLVNSNGTFYFIENGFRKGITSPGIMYACGFEFKDAKPATLTEMYLPTTMLLPCTGSLVKSVQDQTVYLISSGQRYAFTSAQVFTGLGFKFTSVLVVTNPELQALSRATDLNNATAAHLPGTDINMNGTVYWIDGNSQKHAYPSREIYNSWHKDDDFSTVVPANSNDNNLTTGNNVTMRAF